MNILITCVFAAFLMGALLAGLIVFCYRDSVLRKPRRVHKDTESAPSCSDSTGSFVKLNGLFDSPVKVQLQFHNDFPEEWLKNGNINNLFVFSDRSTKPTLRLPNCTPIC